MKKNNLIFLFLTFAFVFGSCKKYDEGPKISFRTKKSRVVGNWSVESAYLYDPTSKNNYDSLSLVYRDSLITRQFQFGDDHKFTLRDKDQNIEYSNVRWNFDSNYESVVLDKIDGKIISLDIKKLEYKDFRVEYKISAVKTLVMSYKRK